MKPLIYKHILTVLITSTLIACSSSGTDSGSQESVIPNTIEDDRPGLIVTGLDGRLPEDVDARWLVNLSTYRDESRTPGHGEVRAGLLDYNQISMLTLIDFYEPNSPDLGECDILITESTDGSSSDGSGGGGGSSPARLSGGESLSIDTPDGVWMTMFSDGAIAPSYETSEDGLLGPIPDNATLTIPGSISFPGVSLYPIKEPDAPIRISPDFEQWATADDIYSWWPSDKDGEIITLVFNGYDAFGDSFVERIANCNLVDSGSFEMPTDLRQTLDGYGGLIKVNYTRIARRVDLVEDMAFHQRSRVSE